MAIHPDPSFPLNRNDQVDVIRIFLELMRERDGSGRTPEVTTNMPFGSHNVSDRSPIPGELLDLD